MTAKDRFIDSLKAQVYDDTLQQITESFSPHPALEYYYLLDEPCISDFAANAYVMRYLNSYAPQPRKHGIQTAWNYINSPIVYQFYVDSVKPNVLMFDEYPLRENTPLESGAVFQQALDKLCTAIGQARLAAMSCSPEIPFWLVCQTFGNYYDAGGCVWNREPTSRELKCMIWLALAHGAKGINHFLYPSIHEGPDWADSGLVDQSTSPPRHRDSLWIPARETNFALKEIGPQLLTLTSDTVFKASDGIPASCFIKDAIIWNM